MDTLFSSGSDPWKVFNIILLEDYILNSMLNNKYLPLPITMIRDKHNKGIV